MLSSSELGPELRGVFPEITRVLAKSTLEYCSMLGVRRTPMFRRPELERRNDPVIDAAYRELGHFASEEFVSEAFTERSVRGHQNFTRQKTRISDMT